MTLIRLLLALLRRFSPSPTRAPTRAHRAQIDYGGDRARVAQLVDYRYRRNGRAPRVTGIN